MMQKVLFRVTVVDQNKSRPKAMKIAATFSGVESLALTGNDRDQLEIIGEGIDTVELAKLLRKKVGGADLLSVGPAKEEKKPAAPAAPVAPVAAVAPVAPVAAATSSSNNNSEAPTVHMQVWAYPMPPYPVYVIREYEPSCSIL